MMSRAPSPANWQGANCSVVGVEWLRAALALVAFILPLVVLPGAEHPFSTPKFFLLGGGVVTGAVLAVWFGLLGWPALPADFRVAFAVWLGSLGASAAFAPIASLEALLLPLFGAGWFLLTLKVRPHPEQLLLALALSGGAVGLIGVAQFFGLDPFRLLGWKAIGGTNPRMRVFATLGNPNFVAAFLVAVMPVTIAFRTRSTSRAALFLALLAIEAFGLVATGSRAALLALAVMMGWLASLRWLARWWALGVAALVVTALVLLFPTSRALTTTLAGRAHIWRVGATHLAERPVLGFGPGAFAVKYAEWETQQQRTGRATAEEGRFAGSEDHAHNDYLEIGLDRGLTGLFSLLALLFSFLRFAFREARRTASAFTAGASAGVVGLIAVGLVDFPLHRPTEVFLFWTFLAVTYIASTPGHPMRTA